MASPSLLILDEAWLFLDDPDVRCAYPRMAEDIAQEKRLRRVRHAEPRRHCEFKLHCARAGRDPVPRASSCRMNARRNRSTKETYQRFGLNARQIELISSRATPKRDYYYQSPLGARRLRSWPGSQLLYPFAALPPRKTRRCSTECWAETEGDGLR